MAINSCGYSATTQELIVDWVHPLFLKANEASKTDNPNWWEAMKSPFANKYLKAAVKESEALEEIVVWEVVHCPEGANVIDSTWAFKIKRFPDGLNMKIKAPSSRYPKRNIKKTFWLLPSRTSVTMSLYAPRTRMFQSEPTSVQLLESE